MRKKLNVENVRISANAAMLLRIFGILIWIMYGICGFLFVRKCDTALVGLPGWITRLYSKQQKRLNMKSRTTTLPGCKYLKWISSANRPRSPQQTRFQNSHACKKKLYGL